MNTDKSKFKIGKPGVFFTITLLLFAMDSTVRAQIYASQDGHLLDANPRLGSMGINPNARLDALVPRVNNNLYITGNITGGSSFQGIVPYRSPLEFQGTLGSSTLSNFRRDSVGVNNLSTSIPSRQPFVDFSRTLTGIRQQRVVNSYELYQAKRAVSTPFTARLDLQTNRTTAIRPLEQPNFSLNVSQPRQFNRFKPLGETGEKPEWFEGPTADILKGKTPWETSSELIQPLSPGQIALGQGQSVLPSDLRVQPIQPLTDEQDMDQSAPSLLTSENRDLLGPTPQLEQELLNALGTGGLGDRNIQYVQPIVPAPVGNMEQGTNDTVPTWKVSGTDTVVGSKILPGAQEQLGPVGTKSEGVGTIEFPGIPPVGIDSAIPQTGTPEEKPDLAKPSPLVNLQPESLNLLTPANPLKQEQPDYWPKPFQPKLPYTGTSHSASTSTGMSNYQRDFEARSRRQYQLNMQKAYELLQKRNYYRAADAYGLAIVYDHTSGAAHQGKAHALFGAGEYMSSAYFLYQALKLDPRLSQARTDLRKLFSDEKKFQSRMKELNDWQTRSKAAELKFLQGYVLYQIGSRDQAKSLLTDALILNPTMKAIQPILNAMAKEKK